MELTWLLWDEHNIDHIATHQVTPAEAEQAVFGPETKGPYRDDRNRPGRLVFFGYTAGENPKALVVVTDRPTPTGEAYVVSARPANDRERKKYLKETS